MEDVIIFSTSVEEHMDYVDEVLSLIGADGITLKLSEGIFLQGQGRLPRTCFTTLEARSFGPSERGCAASTLPDAKENAKILHRGV